MYTFSVITISDKGAAGERADVSGEQIKQYLSDNGFLLEHYVIVPDEFDRIAESIAHIADHAGSCLIVTTGGTGFSKRDVTPEATKSVIEREAPGIAEAIRYNSLSITKRAMLSRGVCGIRGNSLILNLPGSPKAVMESLMYVLEPLKHGLDILTGGSLECAR